MQAVVAASKKMSLSSLTLRLSISQLILSISLDLMNGSEGGARAPEEEARAPPDGREPEGIENRFLPEAAGVG
jgi:hypothetical protein